MCNKIHIELYIHLIIRVNTDTSNLESLVVLIVVVDGLDLIIKIIIIHPLMTFPLMTVFSIR